VPLWHNGDRNSAVFASDRKYKQDVIVLTGRKINEGILGKYITATELRAILGATLAAGKGENEARKRARGFHDSESCCVSDHP
jgi:hypothetical protein